MFPAHDSYYKFVLETTLILFSFPMNSSRRFFICSILLLGVLVPSCAYALSEACITGNTAEVKRLLKALVNDSALTQKDVRGNTPLMNAILHGHEKVVKLLLPQRHWFSKLVSTIYHADIDYRQQLRATNADGFTPLLLALSSTNINQRIAVRLIRFDPSRTHLTIKALSGLDALAIAAYHGRWKALKVLLELLDVNDLSKKYGIMRKNVLMYAIEVPPSENFKQDTLKGVEYLLKKDTSKLLALEENANGENALDIAHYSAEDQVMKRLEKAFNSLGFLMINVCAKGNLKMVRKIMRIAGSHVQTLLLFEDSRGRTPMHHAVRNQHLQVVKLLLNDDGWHTQYAGEPALNYLVQLRVVDMNGGTPLVRALKRKDDIAMYLIRKDFSKERIIRTSEHYILAVIKLASKFGRHDEFQMLLQCHKLRNMHFLEDKLDPKKKRMMRQARRREKQLVELKLRQKT